MLTPQEIDELIQIMKRLIESGKTIIIITHKLKEIKRSADYCTVIRRGEYIDTVAVAEVSQEDLASMMVGRKVRLAVEKTEAEPKEVVFEVSKLNAKDERGVQVLNDLSFQVRAGEIFGIAGVDGNGQTELVEILTGLRKGESGQVLMKGVDLFNKTPRETFDHGITSIPEDRQKHGLVLDFTVAENLILQNFGEKQFSNKGILKKDAIQSFATEMIEKFDIRPSGCENRHAGQLSGGNQQKVIIAREVTNDSELLIAVNPTRGLDVGAIEFVHRYLVEQRNKNRAVLLVSFELDEIMDLSDRIEVIFDGQIVGSVAGGDADEKELGFMMAGGTKDE